MKQSKMLFVVSIMFFLVGSCFITASIAADTLGKIKEQGSMIIGTSADYPPYESVDNDGKFVGFDMDLIREICKRMGVTADIRDMPFDSLIASLQAGKIDALIAALQATPERDEKIDFSIIYHNIKDAFLVKGDSAITMNSAMDAAGHKLGYQTGTVQEKWAKKNLVDTGKTKKDDVFAYERADNGALDVAAGRIEILHIISDAADALVDKMGLKIALLTTETVSAGQAVAIPEGAAALKAEIDRIITEMNSDGSLKELMDKYHLY